MKISINKLFILLLMWIPLCFGTEVIYPRGEADFDQRTSYPLQLLQLALEKSGASLTLKPSSFLAQQGRALKLLEQGQELDVVWSMTTSEREQALLPIRIPIYKGLIGWRIFLIRRPQQAIFDQLSESAELKQLVMGQGHDWPDTQILRADGFRVATAASYAGLFEQLIRQRTLFVPRSVIEIWPEVASYTDYGLAVEQRFALYYPTALYYFVNRHRTDLADIITRGLELALADGSFDALFFQTHAKALEQADLAHRQIYRLPNNLLPAATPFERAELWYRPAVIPDK